MRQLLCFLPTKFVRLFLFTHPQVWLFHPLAAPFYSKNSELVKLKQLREDTHILVVGPLRLQGIRPITKSYPLFFFKAFYHIHKIGFYRDMYLFSLSLFIHLKNSYFVRILPDQLAFYERYLNRVFKSLFKNDKFQPFFTYLRGVW